MTHIDCKKWYSKVVASHEAIEAAIKELGRQPKDAEELQDVINKDRKKAIKSMLTELNKELP